MKKHLTIAFSVVFAVFCIAAGFTRIPSTGGFRLEGHNAATGRFLKTTNNAGESEWSDTFNGFGIKSPTAESTWWYAPDWPENDALSLTNNQYGPYVTYGTTSFLGVQYHKKVIYSNAVGHASQWLSYGASAGGPTSTNIHINAALGNAFRLIMTNAAGFTITAGSVAWQEITLGITQGPAGSATAQWTNTITFGSDIPLNAATLTTNAGKTDYLKFLWFSESNRWEFAGIIKGF